MRLARAMLGVGAALLALPGAAAADGLPVGNVDVGPQGVTVPGDPARIVVLETGHHTVVARIHQAGGRVLRTLELPVRVTVPAVALDGTAGGLSADGGTAVLISPRTRFPRASTPLAVLDARRLRLRRMITLHGDFSFDALSPDGRRMYLVQYVDPRNPQRYLVRSYDLRRGRLDPKPIVDAREPDEDMRGFPITRATSADGRWAYTLYDGAGDPFVHALDTVSRRAACIDLPALAGIRDPYLLSLSLRPGRLDVLKRSARVAAVDTRTLRVVREPAAASRAGAAREAQGAGAGWWLPAGLATVAAAGLVALARVRRGRAPAPRRQSPTT